MEKNYTKKRDCKTINHYCDRSQYGEIGVWDRLKMQFHLFFCTTCRQYSKKNSKLTKTLKKSGLHFLKPQEIQEIKLQLNKKSSG